MNRAEIKISVREIADRCQGEIVGNPDISVSAVEPLFSAQPGSLTFFDPTARKSQHSEILALARNTKASAILLKEPLEGLSATQIITKNPYMVILEFAKAFSPRPLPDLGVHQTAVVHPSAQLGEGVRVGAYAVVGANCQLGTNVTVHPHVVLYPECKLGPNCEIHASAVLRERVELGEDCLVQPGAVIGGEGFGYIPIPGQGHHRIPHFGNVVFGDRVDVGANSGIDRGTLGPTKIGNYTKVDSLVQIGHNNQIGQRSLICGVVGIAGSGQIGDDVVIGGHVGIADHVRIADRVRIGGKSAVFRDIDKAGDYRGDPDPQPVKEHWRIVALIRNLPKIYSELKSHSRRISQLEAQLEAERREIN